MGDKPQNYHITDEGDIYCVNDDGSFTYMGNAEDKNSDNKNSKKDGKSSEKPTHKKDKPKSITLSTIIVVLILFTLWYFIRSRQQYQETETETTVSIPATQINPEDEFIPPSLISEEERFSFSDECATIIGNDVLVTFSYYIRNGRNTTYEIGVSAQVRAFLLYGDMRSVTYLLPANAEEDLCETVIPEITVQLQPEYRIAKDDFGGGKLRITIPFNKLRDSEFKPDSIYYVIDLYENYNHIYYQEFSEVIK